MNNKGVFIKYGDVAVGAKEEFNSDSGDKTDFSDFTQLKKDLNFPKYANPCELYSTALDGEDLPLPSDAQKANIGWWSEQLSKEDGTFETPIVLTCVASEHLFTSIGISLMFDVEHKVYCNNLKIQWYNGQTLLSEKNFIPDNENYFCANKVEYYNKIVITFYSINMPHNRLKLHGITYGYGAEFSGRDLKNVKIIQELDPISKEISINICDFDLISNRDIEFSFQDRQSVETYFDGQIKSKTFIKSFERKSKTQWSVKTEDYIGLMETAYFYGGIYNNKNAKELLAEIFETANIPFEIDDSINQAKLSGYIPYTNCREALMQVAFAIGAVVDTSNRTNVCVYILSDELKQQIKLDRIFEGQKFKNETKVTAVEITAHSYYEVDDEIILYQAEKNGTGNNIFVEFPEPIHDWKTIGHGNLVKFGTNYAIIDAESLDFVLKGKKYKHVENIKTKKNPNILMTDTKNVVSIKDATLVSENNVDNLLEKCYNYFVNSREINLRVAERKRHTTDGIVYDEPIMVGDIVETETEYLGNIIGMVEKQDYNLNGGIIVKNVTMRERHI